MGGQKAFWKLVCEGPADSGSDWEVAQADGMNGPDDRRELGGYYGPSDSRSEGGLHGGAESPVLGFKASGPLIRRG